MNFQFFLKNQVHFYYYKSSFWFHQSRSEPSLILIKGIQASALADHHSLAFISEILSLLNGKSNISNPQNTSNFYGKNANGDECLQ